MMRMRSRQKLEEPTTAEGWREAALAAVGLADEEAESEDEVEPEHEGCCRAR